VGNGAEHGGLEMKEKPAGLPAKDGHEVVDFGDDVCVAFQYPIGIGACAAANKVPGVRAGLCHDDDSARQGVEDDDMSLIRLGGWTW
jgi:ribose 5-phosphate isomerase B